MSAVSHFDTRIDGYREIATMSATLYRPYEPIGRKAERAPSSFLETIVGCRGGLRSILSQVEAVAPTNATVLISGETGTGKEVIARAIHELSPRRSRNLVKVNCAALPAGLLESELFGHERGAFTGAVSSHIGRFALADRGTLFLDEIGDIPLELQPMVRDCEFRKDLYYRLNIFPISLPPLRERKTDIPAFVGHFVQQFAASMDKTIENVPEETMRSLVRSPWPGNIRELQNYVARGVILSTDGNFESVPPEKGEALPVEISNPTLEDKVRQEILAACQRANWKLGGPRGAAARLGLKRTTLFYKMKRLCIARPADNWQD